jgi:four helix bundle protein
MRRAALSVPANIAEGTKKTRPEFRRYLKIAEGSLEEIKYYLIVARDLAYIDQIMFGDLLTKANEVGFLLHRLYSSLTKKNL